MRAAGGGLSGTTRILARVRRLGILVAGLALLAAGCVGHGAVSTAPHQSDFRTVTGAAGLINGGQAPTLSGTTLQGTHASTAADAGHILVINFWASWCPPCRAETPALEQAYQAYRAKGVRFFGVLTEDTAVNGQAFASTNGVSYPSIVDEEGIDLLRFRGLGFVTIPDTVVIDASGRIVARFVGAVTAAALDRVLAEVTAGVAA